jgi:hypothetical protein
MKAKAAETAFREMAKRYGYGWHKYGDVRYCIHCHKPLPKSEQAPDFALWEVYNWVECKNSDASGRWNASELMEGGTREKQREFLLEREGWLFILLGTGRAPNGKSAYLIPFHEWVKRYEPILESNKMRSIRKTGRGKRLGADQMLSSYRLDWNDGGWIIPNGHPFWWHLHTKLTKKLEEVREYLNDPREQVYRANNIIAYDDGD